MAVAGDVFFVRLPGGRFGAIRIIKLMHGYVSSKATYHLVYCSAYLDSKPPTIDDPRLREPVRRHRFAFTGEPAIKWRSRQAAEPVQVHREHSSARGGAQEAM